MSDRNRNPHFFTKLHKTVVRQFLRCQRYDANHILPRFYQLKISGTNIALSLSPFLGRADEGPFHMGPQDSCPCWGLLLIVTDMGKGFCHVVPGTSHRSGQEPSDTSLSLQAAHFRQCRILIIHGVHAVTAVNMHIEEPRRNIAAFGVNRFLNRHSCRFAVRNDSLDSLAFAENHLSRLYCKITLLIRQNAFAIDYCQHLQSST